MTSTFDSNPVQVPIKFYDNVTRSRARSLNGMGDEDFGIWSCRFSADGNEVSDVRSLTLNVGNID